MCRGRSAKKGIRYFSVNSVTSLCDLGILEEIFQEIINTKPE
jgi:hypothetical protein